MKLSIIIFLFLFCNNISFSQPHMFKQDCDGTLNVRSEWNQKFPYNTYPDFIDNYFSKEEKKYFSKKSNLIPITQITNLDNKMVFKDKNINLIIILKDTIVSDSIYMEYIADTNKISYYGDIFSKKNKIIDSIYLNIEDNTNLNLIFPKSLFNDLLKVNQYQKFRSYKPIEFFFDKKNKWFCLYIMGKLNEVEDEYNFSSEASYIAKIIFDSKKQKFFRLAIPSSYALSYGWLYCENFWTF